MTLRDSNTGLALRRRVRRLTVGVVGAAVLASGAVTAGLAYASAADEKSAASPSTGLLSDDTTDDETAVAPQRTTRSALAAPPQAPLAASGRSHAKSGGS